MPFQLDVDKVLCFYQHMYEDLKKNKTVQSILQKYFDEYVLSV
jgi:hypothetical protein